MRKTAIVFTFFVIFSKTIFAIPVANITGTPTNEIINYVTNNYTQILELIPHGKENLYGFEHREMFRNCKVGNPIKVLRIHNEQEIETTNEWRVPLLINGKYITLLTVIEHDQNFNIVDMGGHLLAKLIDNLNSDNEKISFMLRDYRNKTDYVSFELNSFSDKIFYKIQKNENESKNSIQGISLDEIINHINE